MLWSKTRVAIALHDPAEHRLLASRFGQDIGVVILSGRSWALSVLGHPDAAMADLSAHSKRRARLAKQPH